MKFKFKVDLKFKEGIGTPNILNMLKLILNY